MRKQLRAAMVAGLMASGSAWASPDDRDEETDTGELPAPVAHSLSTAVPNGSVVDVERRGDAWVATVKVGLRSEWLRLDGAGHVLERERSIRPRELPAAVRDTIERVFPRSTIWRAARIEAGDEALHEVLLARGDRRTELILDEDGRIVSGVSRS